ncbi:hypothetical protein [Vibrio sp. HN007]
MDFFIEPMTLNLGKVQYLSKIGHLGEFLVRYRNLTRTVYQKGDSKQSL